MSEVKGITNPDDYGIISKFIVTKIHDPEGKHDNCFFFVLDPKHDYFARQALSTYAQVCNSEQPKLASDLRKLLGGLT
jgi:hypothetical protein